MPAISQRVTPFGTTIFTEINELAQQHNALNLGQGRPDFDGPDEAITAFAAALREPGRNQYAPGPGTPDLREAVARHAARYDLDVDPAAGVLVTPGATIAIFDAIMGLVDPGDEVIVVEPFFDSYVPGVLMAGATPVYVAMRPPDWTLDPGDLRRVFNEKTRAILLNTPHNPTGRVYSREELALIAELCVQYDVTAISDEVYEHLVFDGVQHIPIATLPGMAERTVTIGSAGKTFGMTGWKVGWAYGPVDLMRGLRQAHQYIAFATNHPAQSAVARAFDLPESVYDTMRDLYTKKRDLLMQGIEAAGLRAQAPQGTYFVMADFSEVFEGDDVAFARHLITEVGVAVIPPTAFFSAANKTLGSSQTRFAFCKNDATLEQAVERLARLR